MKKTNIKENNNNLEYWNCNSHFVSPFRTVCPSHFVILLEQKKIKHFYIK